MRRVCMEVFAPDAHLLPRLFIEPSRRFIMDKMGEIQRVRRQTETRETRVCRQDCQVQGQLSCHLSRPRVSDRDWRCLPGA